MNMNRITEPIYRFKDKIDIRNKCPDCLHSNFAHKKLERGFDGDYFYLDCCAVDDNGRVCNCKGYEP